MPIEQAHSSSGSVPSWCWAPGFPWHPCATLTGPQDGMPEVLVRDWSICRKQVKCLIYIADCLQCLTIFLRTLRQSSQWKLFLILLFLLLSLLLLPHLPIILSRLERKGKCLFAKLCSRWKSKVSKEKYPICLTKVLNDINNNVLKMWQECHKVLFWGRGETAWLPHDCLPDWLTDWQIDWLTDWQMDWLSASLPACLTD